MAKHSYLKRNIAMTLTVLMASSVITYPTISYATSNTTKAEVKSSSASSSAKKDETAKTSGDVLLASDAEWSINDEGKDLGKDWIKDDYDFSKWKKGKAPFGFGDEVSETNPNVKLGTSVSFGADENNKILTTYAKTKFNVTNVKDIKKVTAYVHVDDGCVVYINGKEAFRRGIKDGEVTFTTPAKFKLKEETFEIPADLLKEGSNVISVEVHQDDGKSSDLWFEMSLTATKGENKAVATDKKVEKKEESKSNTSNTNKSNTSNTSKAKEEKKEDKKEEKVVLDTTGVSRVTMTLFGDSTTGRGFTWYTDKKATKSDLQVVEVSGDETPDFTNAMVFTGKSNVSTNADVFMVHKAEATGLKENTTYKFRVGDASLNLWSEIGEFKTNENDGKFTFIDLADPQAKSSDEAKLAGETVNTANKVVSDSEFMMINGDLVDVGSKEEEWGWLLDDGTKFNLKTTIMAAAGNHEEDKNSFIEHLNLKTPENSKTETGAYYSYDFENTHFIVLNNNEDSKEYRNFSLEQINWIKEDIKKAKENADIKWFIAVMHKGPYSTSNHGTDEDITEENGVRKKFAPMLEELGIDLVLQGHDHIYARTLPIKNGVAKKGEVVTEKIDDVDSEVTINPEGTTYVIPGTAGPKVYFKNPNLNDEFYKLFVKAEEHSAAKYGADPKDAKRPVRGVIQNFLKISVDGNKLNVTVYEIDQKKGKDAFIVDSFGLEKK